MKDPQDFKIIPLLLILLFSLCFVGYAIFSLGTPLVTNILSSIDLSLDDLYIVAACLFACYIVLPLFAQSDKKEDNDSFRSLFHHLFLIVAILSLMIAVFQQQNEINKLNQEISQYEETINDYILENADPLGKKEINTNNTNNQEKTSVINYITSSSHNRAKDLSYVGNKKTKVFHVSTCGFVPRISENHVVEFDDRDEAVNRGYRPCQKCLP